MTILWKIANKLKKIRFLKGISKIFELLNFIICSNAISCSAQIGNNTKFFHRGLGCVIHGKTIIGDNCIIFQNVTIGSKWSNGQCKGESPKVGNNCMIGAGAVLLGNITIGDNVIIGANTVVTKNIPSDSIIIGNQIRRRQNGYVR